MNILNQDLKNILESDIIDWNKLYNKNILITGATGLIGSIIVKSFLTLPKKKQPHLLLVVRDIEKANKLFQNYNLYKIDFIQADLSKNQLVVNYEIDYIIHAASPTHSKYFIQSPVETIKTSIGGTMQILDIARQKKVQSIIYLSSMEMYGIIEGKVGEDDIGRIDILNTRSSYNESKRMSENLCYSYFKEYNVPIKIARLAQVFGPGILENETRVFKQFCDSILNEKNIILRSTGKTIVNYCYTSDAIIAILLLLTKGENGEAYNITSDFNNMTIKDCADFLVNTFGKNNSKVIIDIPKQNQGFAPENKMILLNDKIKQLGWRPKYTILDGYTRLLDSLKNDNN